MVDAIDQYRAGVTDSLEVRRPAAGRVYDHVRRVQLGDVSARGRLRLDGVARFLQDVSDEDTTEIGLDPSSAWVVRRVEARIDAFPVFRERVTVGTWCSGVGARWAERRVSISGELGGRVEAAALWVHLDGRGRPARLPARFDEVYTPVAAGRVVRARLSHRPMPAGAPTTQFPLRVADVDVMRHVNNAVAWAVVEEALAARRDLRAPMRISVEHPAELEAGCQPDVAVVDADGGLDLWIAEGGVVRVSAQVRPVDRPGAPGMA